MLKNVKNILFSNLQNGTAQHDEIFFSPSFLSGKYKLRFGPNIISPTFGLLIFLTIFWS